METRGYTRRRALLWLAGGLALPVLGACSGSTASPSPTASNPLLKPKAAPGVPLTPVLASSELAKGRNRFALGLIDARNQPITSGTVRVDFFKVDPRAGTAQKRSEATAVFRAVEQVNKGIWVTTPDFEEIGPWGAQVIVDRPGSEPVVGRVSFVVKEDFSAPGYGDPAPRSPTPTLADMGGDGARLCSASPPCGLHEISLDAALNAGDRPVVVLFATPAFCTSATCAPELSAVQELQAKGYAERAYFVHVEMYEPPFAEMKPVRAVLDWKLPSEPWVFIADRQGIVRDRFEGAAPVDELEPALRPLV